MDGSVSLSKIWIVSLIIVLLIFMKFWHCMEYPLWFFCIRVLFPHVGSTHLPFHVSNNIANNFLFNIIPPAIPPPPHVQCVSNYFTLQPLSAKHTCYTAYQQDSDMKIAIDRFTLNVQLDQSTILNLPAAYRTYLLCNQLGLLEGCLVYYEQLSFANKHICRIVVPFSFRPKIFNLMHATLVAKHMGE